MSEPIMQPPAEKNSSKDETVVSFSRTTFNYLIVAVTFLIVGVVIGASVFGQNNDGGLTEAAVERIVSQAIAEAGFGSAGPDRFELVDDDPYLGPEDAPVVIVEFSDYRCPYCGRHFEQTLDPLMENYGEYIRYVYRDYAALGPESVAAALAAECANEQGAFWAFHNAFFANQERLSRAYYIETAEANDLDIESFTTCIDEARYINEINADGLDGQINGVNGTPGFFINGTPLRGAQPYEMFERLVLRELEKAGIEPGAES